MTDTTKSKMKKGNHRDMDLALTLVSIAATAGLVMTAVAWFIITRI